jgi:hypothetical protein
MNALAKGLAVALLHTLIVLSLGGKLLYDRYHRPRVWVRTGSMDPNLPIRGRYLTLRLEVQAPWLLDDDAQGHRYVHSQITLGPGKDSLVAYKSESDTGLSVTLWSGDPTGGVTYLDQPVDFFLPEHAQLPQIQQGNELWAQVTIPRKGPPRPILLALKKGTEWTPLSYR